MLRSTVAACYSDTTLRPKVWNYRYTRIMMRLSRNGTTSSGRRPNRLGGCILTGELDNETDAGGDARMDFGTQGMCIRSESGQRQLL